MTVSSFTSWTMHAGVLTRLPDFLESDTFLHSFEMLARIMSDESCHGILIDTSCPIQHRNTIWNCRVMLCNGKILFIRPKMDLANTGA